MKRFPFGRLFLSCLTGLSLCGCTQKNPSGSSASDVTPVELNPVTEQEEAPVSVTDVSKLPQITPIPEPAAETTTEAVEISLMMVGDNLLHTGIIVSGKQDDGTYNYDFEYEDIREFLDAADISIINQETPLGGDDREFTSYPTFNSPTAVADAQAKAGFDVVLGATNHAYDTGLSGLIHFADYYHNNYPNILLCGIHGSETDAPAEAASEPETAPYGPPAPEGWRNRKEKAHPSTRVHTDDPRVYLLDVKGYTFAFINATYSHNWESVARDVVGHLDFLCPYDPNTYRLNMTEVAPQVLDDIREADRIADVVIVCPHWGVEYTFQPMPYQTTMAQAMIDAGADVIIGAHPHVVEPVEWITTPNGNEALCYYSLGNYTSTQDYPERVYEAMAWVQFRDDGDGMKVDRDKSGALSIINHYTYSPLRFGHIYLLEDYSEELCNAHGLLPRTGRRLNMNDLKSWEAQLLGDYALKRADVLGDGAGSGTGTENETAGDEP
ncbi:MAG: CapA family protein [Lachnospiraceae bacterium]|nr:CapA family protein [Lachnospiraceae bacterium]